MNASVEGAPLSASAALRFWMSVSSWAWPTYFTRPGQAARMGGEDRVSTALHVGAAIVDCLPRSPLDSRLVLAVEPARAGDADSVVQGHRGAHGAARLEMCGLMLEFAQGGFPAGL